MKLILYDFSSNFIPEMWGENLFHRANNLATPACLSLATDRFRSLPTEIRKTNLSIFIYSVTILHLITEKRS